MTGHFPPKFRYGVEPEVTGLSSRKGGGVAQPVLKGRFNVTVIEFSLL
jgi:hypothetical protein